LIVSVPRLFLLVAEQSNEGNTSHLHDLEANTRDIANSMTTSTETSDEHLIVLLDVVQAAIIRHKCSDLLAVLDQLNWKPNVITLNA